MEKQTDNLYEVMAARLLEANDAGEEQFEAAVDDALVFVALAGGEHLPNGSAGNDEHVQTAMEIAIGQLNRNLEKNLVLPVAVTAITKLGGLSLDGTQPSKSNQLMIDAFYSRQMSAPSREMVLAETDQQTELQEFDTAMEDAVEPVAEPVQTISDDEISEIKSTREKLDEATDPDELIDVLSEITEDIAERFNARAQSAEDKINSIARKARQYLMKNKSKLTVMFEERLEEAANENRAIQYVLDWIYSEIRGINFDLAQAMLDVTDATALEMMQMYLEEGEVRKASILREQGSNPHVCAQLEDFFDDYVLTQALFLMSSGEHPAEPEKATDFVESYATKASGTDIFEALDSYVMRAAKQAIEDGDKDKAEDLVLSHASTQIMNKMKVMLGL